MVKKIFTVPKRRKREGRTDYNKRLRLLKGKMPRVVIRKSLRTITLQLVTFTPAGDKVHTSVNSITLDSFGWKFNKNNLPSCYLAGFLLGKKAVKLDITDAILDIGMITSVKGNKLYAAAKGMIDAGLKVPCDQAVLPSMDRISGKHIESYFAKNPAGAQFGEYKKNNVNAATITKEFEAVKKKILAI